MSVTLRRWGSVNLSHYQSLDPDMDRGDCQKRVKAGGDALPAHHQATILLLEPGKGPLGLEPRDGLLDRPATVFLGLPDALRELRPDPPLPELLPQRFGIIAFIGRDHLEAFARAPSFAGADLHGIKQRQHLCPLVPIGWRRVVGQGHAAPLRETVAQDPLALAPARDALAATLARGKKRHPRRHTPSASCLIPLQSPECGLAWRPACHPRATVATTDAARSSTPTAARAGHHTSGTL